MAAGSPGSLPGGKLAEDLRDEHLAMVRADFAVVAYDVEGSLPKADAIGPAVVDPLVRFIAADAGAADGRLAIEYALRHVPEVDPSRLYAAGAGPSGSVAIVLAAADRRIRGCAVRAPIIEFSEPLLPFKDRLNDLVQDGFSFLHEQSPIRRAGATKSPIWVFHAVDDSDVPASESERFARSAGNIILILHPPIGHARQRVEVGRAGAVAWLTQLDNRISGGLRSTSQPSTQVSTPSTRPVLPFPPATTRPKPAPPATQPVPAEPEPVVPPTTQPATPPASRPASQPSTRPVSELPPIAPPPIDPTRQRVSDAAARLINLGANVRLDPTGQYQTSLVDLSDVADWARAAEHLPLLGKVAVVHLNARQINPAIAGGLKSLPFIARLDIDPEGLADAHFEHIGTLANVEELSLLQAEVRPNALKALAGMTGLRKLNLRGARIEDAACEHLGKLVSLRTLDLSDTRITGAGISRLKGLSNLVTLRLKNTPVASDAIDELRASLPKLNIIPP